MIGKVIILVLPLGLGLAWAQQGGTTNHPPAEPAPQTSGQNAASKPPAGASETPSGTPALPSPQSKSTSNPGGLSDDLTFPESDPGEPVAPTVSKSTRMAPPRSDRVNVEDLGRGAGESSSRDSQIDLSPPSDDTKAHPQSSIAIAEAETTGGNGVSEFHTWDPHKAAKSVEVGDFYFKRKNYRAAEDRYREALRYKDNDAIATLRLAVCLEKLGALDGARAEYESYLKILPHGAQVEEAQKAIDRLKADATAPK